MGILFLLGSGSIYGQSMQKIEQELLTAFKRIDHWAEQEDIDPDLQYDSLQAANAQFGRLLIRSCSKNPVTLRSEFRSLQEQGLSIAASQDGLFRIYTWDTRQGGTAHIYDGVYQYKANDTLYAETVSRNDDEPGRWYSYIYSVQHEEKVFYIGLFHGKAGTIDLFQGVKLFAIEGNRLNKKVNLFKTQSGLRNEISFSFDLSTAVGSSDDFYKLVYFDEREKHLHIPVVLENGKVTRNFIEYIFDDDAGYFARSKN